MRRFLYGLSCFLTIQSCSAVARADADYYEAFKSADAAVKVGRFDTAVRTIQSTLRKYPNDYALTLKLAWVHFQGEHYADAEGSYRTAIDLSDGSLDARTGLGWALIQQDRCNEGIKVLQSVVADEADDNAVRGLLTCADRARLHGTIWAVLGGALYQDHPWLHLSGASFLGFNLRPSQTVSIGGAYRFSELVATDRRIPSFTQHEIYVEAGYIGKTVDLLGQAALIWGGDAVVGGSRHVGTSLRFKRLNDHLGEVLIEATGSFYGDLWVIGLAPSSTLTFGQLSATAGVSAEQFAHETLISASLTSALVLGDFTVW
ncbi:MAG TPA: tetratricopeptide repeat protein, partial [Polyangiales bacterium]|nr:tetratricopeptide repeat protein [Polyangiales bacterium]